MAWAPVARMQTASPKCPGNGAKSRLGHLEAPQQFGEEGPATVCAPCHTCRRALTWMPFSCRFRYRVLTGMLAGTSASSLRVQITRLAWLLQEQAAGHEVAGGEPPPAAKVKATPPPPAPRGGENSQRKSRAPWGQDILPGGSGGHGEPRARAILNVHAPCGRRGAVGDREGQAQRGTRTQCGPDAPQHPAVTITTSPPIPPPLPLPQQREGRSQVTRRGRWRKGPTGHPPAPSILPFHRTENGPQGEEALAQSHVGS